MNDDTRGNGQQRVAKYAPKLVFDELLGNGEVRDKRSWVGKRVDHFRGLRRSNCSCLSSNSEDRRFW